MGRADPAGAVDREAQAEEAVSAGREGPGDLEAEEGLAADGEEVVVAAEEAAVAGAEDARRKAALRAWGGCGACSG